MNVLALALGLGFVSGLRTFTGVAALAIAGGGAWRIAGVVAAAGEYVADVLPATPSRTEPVGLAARLVSGAFVGWNIAARHSGSRVAGAVAGVAGASLGTYGGHAARVAAGARIGNVRAGLAEDVLAISLATLIVSR
jgi:uncharacterized membrane protein